ncbi:hypothetical protein Tco_1340739 [Tanacetum coccineum]
MTKILKVKENALDVEIRIISSENVQSRQGAIIKELLLEEHGVIVAQMRKKRLKTKLVVPAIHQPPQASFPQLDSKLVVPLFLPSDGPITSLNKAIAFISITFTSKFQGRQTQGYACSGVRSNAIAIRVHRSEETNPSSHAKVAMLVEALESGVALDEEYMAFLVDNEDIVTTGQASQEILTPTAFQTDDLDAFDSYCDEALSTRAVLMAMLSAYDSKVLSKESQDNKIIHESLTAKLERYEEQIKKFKERQNFDLNDREKYRWSIAKAVDVLKEESKAKEDKYLDDIICLEKKYKALDNVINQMETKVAKCFVDRKYLKIEKKELFIKNDCLLKHIMCLDVMWIFMHADVESKINTLATLPDYNHMEKSYLDEYNENLELKAKRAKKKDMVD